LIHHLPALDNKSKKRPGIACRDITHSYMKEFRDLLQGLLVLSALLLSITFFVPVWEIRMWAPQYPEGLEMNIWLYTLTGDYKIISGLNHYIGMKHIEVEMFPEFAYMPYVVAILILIGLTAAAVNKKWIVYGYSALLIAAGVAGLVDFYQWGYEYGHNLDPHAPIIVPGMAYQPPLIGTKQLLNFTAYSGPASGAIVLLVVTLMSLFVSLVFSGLFEGNGKSVSTYIVILAGLGSCTTSPEPLQPGVDACHACKMTIMDNRFGAEVITQKGKIFKFDDTSCLMGFLKEENMNKPAFILVVEYSSTHLIDVQNAFFVKAEKVGSPMAGNIAAFSNAAEAEKFRTGWNGEMLGWIDLQKR
jgi:copper chaperone NosL